jgi:GT2 family glycosyltransferase
MLYWHINNISHYVNRHINYISHYVNMQVPLLQMLVSVIIVNYNGKVYLDKCLDSIKKTTLYSELEVLVIDNNSADGSVDLVKEKYPEVKTIELKENVGFAAANNLAAKQAMGELYVFLNNDTIVTKTWLSELVKSVAENDRDVAIAQSLLLLGQDGEIDSSGDFIDKYGRPYSSKLRNAPNGREILSARAASMIIRKDVFWKLGGFEEDFFASFEDVHLGWKAWIAGYKVILASNSIVYHFAGQTVKNLKNTMNFHSMKNQACIILLNFEFPLSIKNLFSLLPLYRPSIRSKSMKDEKEGEKKPQVNVDNLDRIAPATYSNPILLKDVLKTSFWICSHFMTLYKKYNEVNQMRIFSSNYLAKMGLITENRFEK